MIRIAKLYPDKAIVVTLSQQLSWSHLVKLIAIGDTLNGVHVAQYLSELPPRKILEEKLRHAIELAREKHVRLQLLKENK